jgi:lipopolysaccharide export system protein LptA
MKYLIGFGVFICAVSLAAGSRVITITAQKRTGSPLSVSVEYSGNVQGKVQNLSISAPKAVLAAPAGSTVVDAEGKRSATFEGGTTATRGRLTATGPSLEYKEVTGLGVLSGPVQIKITPEKKEDDQVSIQASKATFDVDTNVSTSEGSVKLVNGGQTATSSKVVYDEQSDLGCLSDSRTVTIIREPKKAGDPRLVITSKETRVNTKSNKLVASGGVKLEAGDNVTIGDALYYDDAKDTAWVIGNPAKNTNKKSGVTISAGSVINYTKRNQVERLGNPYKIPFEQFKCPEIK